MYTFYYNTTENFLKQNINKSYLVFNLELIVSQDKK